jgi:hypothetical protein
LPQTRLQGNKINKTPTGQRAQSRTLRHPASINPKSRVLRDVQIVYASAAGAGKASDGFAKKLESSLWSTYYYLALQHLRAGGKIESEYQKELSQRWGWGD